MFLSCLCVLHTAVSCQPLIVCFLYVFVRLIGTLYSCVLSTFDYMLYEGFCHDYIYSIQLCDVNRWLHFVFVVLSWAYILYTAVCCQPLIVCCMCVVACLYVVNTRCAVNLCVFLLICNLCNEFYALMLIIILYNISLVLNHLLKPIKCVNNESA